MGDGDRPDDCGAHPGLIGAADLAPHVAPATAQRRANSVDRWRGTLAPKWGPWFHRRTVYSRERRIEAQGHHGQSAEPDECGALHVRPSSGATPASQGDQREPGQTQPGVRTALGLRWPGREPAWGISERAPGVVRRRLAGPLLPSWSPWATPQIEALSDGTRSGRSYGSRVPSSRTATRTRFDPGQRTACRCTSPRSGLTRFSASRRARWLADWRWLFARRGERIRARLRGVNPTRHPRCSRGCPGPRVSGEARVDRR